ncbi:MAG: hypothetical protein ACRDB1_16325, partial [Microcoleaceae cyanobacterium]
ATRKSQLPINQNSTTNSIPKEQVASRLQAVTNKPLEANSLGDKKTVNENKSPVKPANVKSPITNTTKSRTNTPPIAQPESLNISEDKLKSAVNPNIKDNAQTKINYVEPGQTQILPIAGLNTAQKLQSSSQKNPINLAKLPKLPKKIVSSEKSQLIANNVVKNPESGILATSNTKSSAINTNAINTKSAESTIKSPAINTKSSEQKSATPATIKPINQKPSTISQIQPDRLPTEQIRDLLPPPIKQPAKVRKTLKTFGQDLLKVPPVLIPIPPEQNTPIPLLNKQPKPKVTRRDMLKAITNTALRYPAISNPTDKLTFDAPLFKPSKDQVYTDIDIRFAENNPVVNKLTIGYFPENEQFYWALPGNRLVLETKGWQVGSRYRGQSREFEFKQSVTFSQNLWGLQAIWLIPQAPSDLIGNFDPKQVTIQATAAEVVNPPGVPTGRVVINSGVNPNDPNVTVLSNSRPPAIGAGTTNNPSGGGALFDNLTPDNTPSL